MLINGSTQVSHRFDVTGLGKHAGQEGVVDEALDYLHGDGAVALDLGQLAWQRAAAS